MGSKVFLLSLGLLLAIVLAISSEVAARSLAENSADTKFDAAGKELNHDDGGHGGHGGGGGRGGSGGHGGHGGGGNYGGGGGRGGGGKCYHGCCKSGYKGCQSCCRYAGEAAEVQAHAKPQN